MTWQKISFPGFGVAGNSTNVAMAFHRMELYVAVTNSTARQVQIWKCHPSYFMSPAFISRSWTRVDILPTGRVDSMVSYGDKLLVGDYESPNVFSYSLTGRRSTINAGSSRLGANSMIEFKGSVYIVFYGRPLEIRRSRNVDLTEWEIIGGLITEGLGVSNYSGILTKDENFLYLGTGSETPGGGGLCQIWRSLNGSDWEILVDNSFGDSGNGAVSALHVFRGKLYGSTTNHFSGNKLYEIDLDRTESFRAMTISNLAPIRAIASWREILYAAEGNNPSGAALFYKRPGDDFTPERTGFEQDLDPGRPEVIVPPYFIRPILAGDAAPINSVFLATFLYSGGDALVWRQSESGRRYVTDWIFESRPVVWLFRRIPLVPFLTGKLSDLIDWFLPRKQPK